VKIRCTVHILAAVVLVEAVGSQGIESIQNVEGEAIFWSRIVSVVSFSLCARSLFLHMQYATSETYLLRYTAP